MRIAATGSSGVGMLVVCLVLSSAPGQAAPDGHGGDREDPGHAAPGSTFTRAFDLQSGAYRFADLPNVVVHGQTPADRRGPLDLVVFLHGFRGCAVAQMASKAVACGKRRHRSVPGRGLARVHAGAGTGTLLVVPQLALLARDGSPGRFVREGAFAAFLTELLDRALAPELGAGAFARVRRVALLAHSAGYQAALAILEHGGAPDLVRDVVLLDALYAGPRRFEGWLRGAEDRRLISLHAGRGKPARHSRGLARRLRRAGLPALRLQGARLRLPARHPVGATVGVPRFRWAVAEVDTPHARFPQVHMAALIRLLFSPPERSERSE